MRSREALLLLGTYRVARLSVDGEQIEIVVETREYGSHLAELTYLQRKGPVDNMKREGGWCK